MMKGKILVTGGAGYIGSHIVKQLVDLEYDVVVYDNLSTGNRSACIGAELIVGDLEDSTLLSSTFKSNQFDAVMHFAGSIIVPESVKNPLMYYKNNTLNSLSLVEVCLEYNVSNFIFSSTAATYGIPEGGIAVETMDTKPINPYGMSKLMTEQSLKDIANAHSEFEYVALRYFNVSGADPSGKIGQAFPGATHLIKVNCEAASGKRDKTYIFGDDFDTFDGTGVRDYIHVVDLATAHIKALEYLLNEGKSDVFNCGYGKGFSVKEVIHVVKEVSGIDFPVEVRGRRAGDPAVLVANSDKIKSKLKWNPEFNSLEKIIKSAYDWERGEVLASWRR